MIILAVDGSKYLVKTKSSDDKCFLVDIDSEFIYGYDRPEKFLRFGYYRKVTKKDINKNLENRLRQILI